MSLLIRLAVAAVALWVAHKAGAAYVLSYTDPERRRIAVLGTILSTLMLAAVILGD
jgi:hypothetical protein